MTAFFAGMERAGAATASIVSTLEPVVTVALAAVFLGEQLSAVEAFGAASVLVAVRLLQGRAARLDQPLPFRPRRLLAASAKAVALRPALGRRLQGRVEVGFGRRPRRPFQG
jgi:hypothetical protein